MSLVFGLVVANVAPAVVPEIIGGHDVQPRQHEAVTLARAGELDEAL